MKRSIAGACVTFFLCISHYSAAQFNYTAWNLGLETGRMKFQNSLSSWGSDGQHTVMYDSADTKFMMNNWFVNIDALSTNYFVKCHVSLPLVKSADKDSTSVVGRNFNVDLRFGGGFDIKDKVAFTLGVNVGIFNLGQEENTKIPGGITRADYFTPNSLSSTGQKMWGSMAAWQTGFSLGNMIVFNDKMALNTTFSRIGLKNKKNGIDADMGQLEFALYYSDRERHNIGFKVGLNQNWLWHNGYNLDKPVDANHSTRIYPAGKASTTTIFIGVNLPIVFAALND